VHVGDIFNFRYVVLQKLGWGHFSTVWMCLDRNHKNESPQYVAMKVQKSAPHYREAALDEIELLSCIKKAAVAPAYQESENNAAHESIVVLLDHFEHTGPNGRHVCMVFEMLGENLLSVIKKYDYKGIPIDIVRKFTLMMCRGLDFMHTRASIIHTDLKPENILIADPPSVPSEEFVKALVEMGPTKNHKAVSSSAGAGGTGGKKKGKGKGKAKGKGVDRGAGAGAGGGGSVEAKKRMKKKQKKKRQKENRKAADGDGDGSVEAKQSPKPKGTGSGGGGEETTLARSALALSAAEENREMMMMEKASEPGAAPSSALGGPGGTRLSEIALREATLGESKDSRSRSRSRSDSRSDSDKDGRSDSEDYDRGGKKSSAGAKAYGNDSGDKKRTSNSPAGAKKEHLHLHKSHGHLDDSADAKAAYLKMDSFNSVDDSLYEGENGGGGGGGGGTSASLRLQMTAYQDAHSPPPGDRDRDRDREGVCSKALLRSCELSWLRPTLFAFLNFTSPESHSSSEGEGEGHRSPPPTPLSTPLPLPLPLAGTEDDSDGSMFLYHIKGEGDNAEYLDSPFSAKISMVC
jgi:hypothetical protein